MSMGEDQTTIWFYSEDSRLPIDDLVLLCIFYSLSRISLCLQWLEKINSNKIVLTPSNSSNRIWQDISNFGDAGKFSRIIKIKMFEPLDSRSRLDRLETISRIIY